MFANCTRVCRLWRSVCYDDLDQLSAVRGSPPASVWRRYKQHIVSILSQHKTIAYPIESARLTSLMAPEGRVRLHASLPSLRHIKVDGLCVPTASTGSSLSFPMLTYVHIRSGASSDLRLLQAAPCVRIVSIKRLRAAQICSLFHGAACMRSAESVSLATVLEWPANITFTSINRTCPMLRVLRLTACMIDDRMTQSPACLQNVETLHLSGTMMSTQGMINVLSYFPNVKVLRLSNNPKVHMGQLLGVIERLLPALKCLNTDTEASLVVRLAVRSRIFNVQGNIRVASSF